MTDETTAAQAAEIKPEDRIRALVQAMTDGLLGEATRDELLEIQRDPGGLVTRLRSDMYRFAANLVSIGQPPGTPQAPAANFHTHFEPRSAAVHNLGIMRTLGMSEN